MDEAEQTWAQLQAVLNGQDTFLTEQELEAIERRYTLGAAVEAMPKMLEPKDVEYEDNDVDYVQIGIGESGTWNVTRWYDGECADLGPIGHGSTPLEALNEAIKRLELTE